MKRTLLNAWLAYAVAGLILTAAAAGLAGLMVADGETRAIWTAAALAYVLQLFAFAMLLALRSQAHLFLMAWLGGMVLRFGALAVVAFWLSRTNALPRGATLVSFVGFVFLLLLLEPIFLRWDLRRS